MGRKTKKQLLGFPGGKRKVVTEERGDDEQRRESASFRKLQGSTLPQPTEYVDGRATGYRMIDLGCLQAYILTILGVTCFHCNSHALVLEEEESKRQGWMSSLRLRCLSCCWVGNSFGTSPRRQGMEAGGKSYDVNRRAVFASLVMGESSSGLQQFCAVMGMPPPSKQASWDMHMKKIGETLQQTSEESIQRAVDEIRTKHGHELQEDEITDEAVSFDGTWAKRGHSSLFGVQVAIHMDSGKVLDTQVHSKLCLICRKKEEEFPDQTSDEYLAWKETHAPVCTKNTKLSSNAMEAQGAKEIWCRSMEKNRMRYTTFVGDGDSKAWKSVCDEKPYGDVEIRKADCIGHVQKRMGSQLRDWKNQAPKKLEDGQAPGGKLTVQVIDEFQRYYGMAIRNNLQDVSAMSAATKAILYHSTIPFQQGEPEAWPGRQKGRKIKKVKGSAMSEAQWETKEAKRLEDERHRHQLCHVTTREQHQYCPEGEESWCGWQKDQAVGTSDYEEKGLPHVFFDELKPTFDKLADEKLLARCKDGYTQNQNESFNGMIWNHVPKHKFYGYRTIKAAVNMTTAYFNDGAGSYASTMTAMGIPPNKISLIAMQKMDQDRIEHAERCKKEETKARRVELRRKKAKRADTEKRQEGTTYKAGGFGDDMEPPPKVARTTGKIPSRGRRKIQPAAPVSCREPPQQASDAPIPPTAVDAVGPSSHFIARTPLGELSVGSSRRPQAPERPDELATSTAVDEVGTPGAHGEDSLQETGPSTRPRRSAQKGRHTDYLFYGDYHIASSDVDQPNYGSDTDTE
ncbi:uncharacterized protein LOC134178653 [Corticium candelabrum]|uniref:uncharacterized protein LOC134178653 n=1 Tax=Corticium candelabrum TaxID=121492 RepID=UPI002E259DC3|nr:uncharacterized protein LOC134178653 [Corticium candelabrum]